MKLPNRFELNGLLEFNCLLRELDHVPIDLKICCIAAIYIAVLALTSLEVGQYSGLTFRSTTELKELLLKKKCLYGYMKAAVKAWR